MFLASSNMVDVSDMLFTISGVFVTVTAGFQAEHEPELHQNMKSLFGYCLADGLRLSAWSPLAALLIFLSV